MHQLSIERYKGHLIIVVPPVMADRLNLQKDDKAMVAVVDQELRIRRLPEGAE